MRNIPIAVVEKLIRESGANRVSEMAAVELRDFLEKHSKQIAAEAAILAEHAGRKTVKTKDIELVLARLLNQ